MATNKQRSRETEDAIIKAAMKLALSHGVSEVSIRDICNEAKVSIGSFYHHFPSKQILITRAFQVFDDELVSNISLNEKRPSLESLMELLLYHTNFVATRGGKAVSDYYTAILNDTSHSASDPRREYYKVVYRIVSDVFNEGYITNGFSIERASEILIQFVRGSIIDWCLHNQEYDVVAKTKEGLEVLIRGLFEKNIS